MKFLILILLMALPLLAAGQTADGYFERGEWAEAVAAYAQLVKADDSDGRAWFRLAVSARRLGDFERARDALDKAAALDYSQPRVALERARIRVLSGDRSGAIDELSRLVAGGFSAVNVISNDEILSSLRGDTGFDTLMADLAVLAYPCEHDPRFAEFDFWIGAWEVRDSQGNFLGSNNIQRAEHGCVLIENWTGAGGSTGTSINYLDKTSNQWVQIWNDAGGGQIDIRGGMTAGGMRLVGTIHSISDATTVDVRGLWTAMPDGRVRQFFEQSTDGGATWAAWFEGFYTRRTPE